MLLIARGTLAFGFARAGLWLAARPGLGPDSRPDHGTQFARPDFSAVDSFDDVNRHPS